jgi:Zn-dependent peptidase ImmA (M78 family)
LNLCFTYLSSGLPWPSDPRGRPHPFLFPIPYSPPQRFTIAHELGHYFFHVGLEQHVDQDFRIAWRNADSSKAVNWTEIEANQFAAQLLMPTAFLEDDLDELQVIDKRAVLLLAGKYIVSREAMTIRLSQLGLTGPY